MATVKRIGPLRQCLCGCGLTFLKQKDWRRHYLDVVIPKLLHDYVQEVPPSGEPLDVDDPRNFKIF